MKDGRELTGLLSGGKEFWAKGAAMAHGLTLEYTSYSQRTPRRPTWLECEK